MEKKCYVTVDFEDFSHDFKRRVLYEKDPAINKEALNKSYEIIFTERSIFTDKNVFAKMLYDSDKMNKMEYNMYNYWFKTFKNHFNFNINYIIYLRVDPKISYNRIQIRKREEENNIKYDYIEKVHNYHDEWISDTKSKICIVDGNKEFKDDLNNQSIILSRIREFIDNYNK